MKKFSIPFNGSNPKEYLSAIEPYKEHIDHIFTGVGFVANSHLEVKMPLEKLDSTSKFYLDEYEENIKEFLNISLGKYKRFITLNSMFYDMDKFELIKWLETKLCPFVESVKIDGCICTDFNIAKVLHYAFPNLEIHTSCNCYQWNIRQMEIWQQECGVTVFNPPREILRTPAKLKEMHDAGFKIKAIVNESCLFGCPQSLNHNIAMANNKIICLQCNRGDIVNFLKGNWVLPRWLDKLDEYVDIYKITGRSYSTQFLLDGLDAYVNRRDVDNLPLILAGENASSMISLGIKIPSSVIHDKLLYCECKKCDKTCFDCRILMAKLLLSNNFVS